MESIKDVLVRRDNISEEEAEELIEEARKAINERLDKGDFQSAYDICEDYFGLEPDYIMELIP